MYREFYDLTQNPFSNTPDPAFLFLSPGHKAVLQALLDNITAAQGCVALVGEAGLGKTLLLRALLERLEPRHYKPIWVWYPALSLQEMLKSICQASGLDCPIDDPVATARYLQHTWLEEHQQGRQVLLIIDEAHNIPGDTLEGLLRLASFNVAPGKPLLHIVFAGLPAFWQRLHGRPLRHVKKPCLTRVRLSALTRKESLEYIRHRLLKVVSSEDTLFTKTALQQIVHYARGNPGMLNTLCINMLVTSRLYHEKFVSAEIAQEVLAVYRKRRSRSRLWWGVAYAAGVLLVVSLVGGVRYGHLMVSPRGSLELFHLAQRALRPWSAHGALPPVDVAVPILPLEPAMPFVSAGPAVSPVHMAAVPEPQMPFVPLPPAPFAPQIPDRMMPRTSATATPEKVHKPTSTSEPPGAGQVAQTPVVPPETVQATKNSGTSKDRHSVPPDAMLPIGKRPPAVPPARVAALPAPRTPPVPKTTAPRAPDRVVPRAPERAASKRSASTVVPEPPGALPGTAAPVVPPETVRATEPPGARDAGGGALASKRLGTREGTPTRDRETVQARPSTTVPASPLVPPGAPWLEGTPRFVVEAGGHAAMIRQLLFTADGRELISVGDDKTIRVWSVTPDGRQAALARTIRGQVGDGPEGMLAAAALSPPNAAGRQQWLAVGGVLAGSPRDRYAVRLHDYASGEVVSLLPGHEEAVLALAFSPTGRWLASAGKDCTVRLWDLASLQGSHLAKAPLVLAAHTNHIYDLAWSATGDRLASASYDHSVGLWNTEQLAQGQVTSVARLRGHDHQVQTVAFHPEGSVLASGGKDQTIRLWRAQDGAALEVFARPKHKVSALAFAPDGRSLLAGNFSPPRPDRLTLLAYPSGKTQQAFTGHQNVVVATAFHPSGQWVASGGGEQKEILLWQVHTGEVLSRLAGTGRTIYAVGFSRDGRYLSWGQTPSDTFPNTRGPLEHRFDLAQLVRLSAGISAAAVVRAQESVGGVSLSAERGGPYDYHYRLHVHRGQRRLSTLERGDTDGYRHSAYTLTPDAQGVLSGGMNGVLRLYALDGTLRATFLGHTGEIRAVAVSPDGQWALSGSNDQTLRLWSLAALPAPGSTEVAPTLTLFPATDGEWVAWTPEGAMVASPHGARLLGYSINQGPDKVARYVPAEQWPARLLQPEMILTKLQSQLP